MISKEGGQCFQYSMAKRVKCRMVYVASYEISKIIA